LFVPDIGWRSIGDRGLIHVMSRALERQTRVDRLVGEALNPSGVYSSLRTTFAERQDEFSVLKLN
jgi:hypothetical protein